MPLKARRLPTKWLVAACVAYALAAVIGWLALRYLSDRWWPATVLLYALRWPWLLPLLVLLPMSVRRGKWLWILPALTGLFILGPVMGFNIPRGHWHDPVAGCTKVRLLSCNVHRLELSVPALDAYIVAVHPDIVVLQDYSGWDDSPVLSGTSWNTYRMGEIFIATHYAIRGVHDLHLDAIHGVEDAVTPRRPGAAACFDLQSPAGPLRIIDMHLASPHTPLVMLATDPPQAVWLIKANSTRRWKESQAITDWLASHPGPPTILAGDFNTLAKSPIYRHFWARYPDAFPSTDWGYGYTHYSLLSELRIDHVLAGRGVQIESCRIGPACGTPHRPLVVDLAIPKSGS